MKRVLALVFLCGAGSCVAGAATAAKKDVPHSVTSVGAKSDRAALALAKLAPADEYFGPLKLSIIGIQNTIRDIGLRYDYNHDLASSSFATAQLAEGAVRDWAHRYSRDPQLPRNIYRLQRLYTKILLQRSRDRAAIVANWLATDFAASPQAKELKKTLALEHLDPLPSPSPTASATPAPSPEPSTSAGPETDAPSAPSSSSAPAPSSPLAPPSSSVPSSLASPAAAPSQPSAQPTDVVTPLPSPSAAAASAAPKSRRAGTNAAAPSPSPTPSLSPSASALPSPTAGPPQPTPSRA